VQKSGLAQIKGGFAGIGTVLGQSTSMALPTIELDPDALRKVGREGRDKQEFEARVWELVGSIRASPEEKAAVLDRIRSVARQEQERAKRAGREFDIERAVEQLKTTRVLAQLPTGELVVDVKYRARATGKEEPHAAGAD
jgi:hypothetical protein